MSSISRRRVFEIVRKEFRQMFRDPRMKGVVFVSPIIQLLLFGYAVNTDVRTIPTVVLDYEKSTASRALIDALTASGYFQVTDHADFPRDIARQLDRGEAVVGIQIPPDFSRGLATGRFDPVQIIVDGTNSNTGTVARSYAVEAVQAFAARNAGIDRDNGPIDLRVRAWFNPELKSRVYNVPGVIGLLLLLMCMLLTALAVVREREVGTLDQLLVTPIRAADLMLGKTIPVAIIGLIDLVLISTVAIAWFGIPFRGSPIVLLTATSLFILAGLSLGLLISSSAKTQQEAFMTMFLFVLPAIVLSDFLYPVESMPVFFQYLTIANPVRHFLDVVRDVFLKGSGFDLLWPQILTLGLMAIGALWAATLRFRASYDV